MSVANQPGRRPVRVRLLRWPPGPKARVIQYASAVTGPFPPGLGGGSRSSGYTYGIDTFGGVTARAIFGSSQRIAAAVAGPLSSARMGGTPMGGPVARPGRRRTVRKLARGRCLAFRVAWLGILIGLLWPLAASTDAGVVRADRRSSSRWSRPRSPRQFVAVASASMTIPPKDLRHGTRAITRS
jgi:hypothetical protein